MVIGSTDRYYLLADNGKPDQSRMAFMPKSPRSINMQFEIKNAPAGLRITNDWKFEINRPEMTDADATKPPSLKYTEKTRLLEVDWSGETPAKAKTIGTFKRVWSITPPGKAAVSGEQEYTFYVTAGNITKAPAATLPWAPAGPQPVLYETVVRIGCEAAAGLRTLTHQDDVIAKFKDAFGPGKDIKRMDGTALKYYGTWKVIDPRFIAEESRTYSEMLQTGDGNCQAWANLFLAVCRANGIDYQFVQIEVPQEKWTVG
jgi:hypothetical protein